MVVLDIRYQASWRIKLLDVTMRYTTPVQAELSEGVFTANFDEPGVYTDVVLLYGSLTVCSISFRHHYVLRAGERVRLLLRTGSDG